MTTSPSWQNLEQWDPAPFRSDLESGGYTFQALPGLSKFGGSGQTLHATPESPQQECLIRLFLSGDPVSREQADRALPHSFQSLLDLGLLHESGGPIVSLLRIRPIEEGYCAEDFPRFLSTASDEESPEFVMGVAPTTRMLRRIIPDLPRKTTLDLCCGGGWLSLQEALKGGKVVGSDLSERCLSVARFNSRLCGSPPVDWRAGPWFSTVENQTFDLIISNPPFVQSPGGKSMALDTPADEDPVQLLLANLKDHLNPGGFGCLLLNWQYQHEDDWSSFPLSCLPDEGFQILLFEIQRHDPKSYAMHWLQQDVRYESPEERDSEAQRWVDYLKARGAAGVSSGFVVVRRCQPGEEWTLTESRDIGFFSPKTSGEIARVFQNQTYLHQHPKDRSLLDDTFTGVPGLTQTTTSLLVDGRWTPSSIRLQSPGKLMYDGHVDVALLKILEEASSGHPIRQCLPEIARLAGASSTGEIENGVEGLLAELVGRGLLEPRSNL